MTTGQVLELVAVGLAALTALSGLATGRSPRIHAVGAAVLLGAALALVWFAEPPPMPHDARQLVLLAAAVLAVAGGGLVTTQVFTLVDDDSGSSLRHPGEVLRGGAWIGALERLGVYVALVAGWAPGLAIVLALKGLGRYPELRNEEDTTVAERFIIGTFTSVLWAVACAGLASLTR